MALVCSVHGILLWCTLSSKSIRERNEGFADSESAKLRNLPNAKSCFSKSLKTLSAIFGPMPGNNLSTRKADILCLGLSAHRKMQSISFTCEASRNLRPPCLTKGILRRVSSSSNRSLW